MATTKANNAMDSNKANDNILLDFNSLAAEGLRAIDSVNVANNLPNPNPTPNNGNTAIPAPINFAASTSI